MMLLCKNLNCPKNYLHFLATFFGLKYDILNSFYFGLAVFHECTINVAHVPGFLLQHPKQHQIWIWTQIPGTTRPSPAASRITSGQRVPQVLLHVITPNGDSSGQWEPYFQKNYTVIECTFLCSSELKITKTFHSEELTRCNSRLHPPGVFLTLS